MNATNGAEWWARQWTQRRGDATADRIAVLRAILADYRALMHSNAPVHTWG